MSVTTYKVLSHVYWHKPGHFYLHSTKTFTINCRDIITLKNTVMLSEMSVLLVRTATELSNILVISWVILLACLWKRWNSAGLLLILRDSAFMSVRELFKLKRNWVVQLFPYEDLGLKKCQTYRKGRIPQSANQSKWVPALPAWKNTGCFLDAFVPHEGQSG